MRRNNFLLLPVILSFFSCGDKGKAEFSSNECKKMPAFVNRMGFSQSASFFNTTDANRMGLWLMQSSQPGNPNARIVREYQHPGWKQAGWLAPVLLDNNGNLYTAPAPFVNILYNPIANNNTLYKVDNVTGEMKEFIRLPEADSINPENPYGILAITYLCETGTLYVSTVAGSTRYKQNGHIYAIDAATAKIIDQLDNIDAMGVGISYITGKRELYFGNARNSEINRIALDKHGKFTGPVASAFSLAGLGVRGDDKARKIQADRGGNLQVYGIEFNFNLIAPREKQESRYEFYYDDADEKWKLKGSQ
jgi:hypothetical protein